MRDMRFEFKLSEGEYLRMKRTAFVLGMTMADLIRNALDLKCAEMSEGMNELLKEQDVVVRCRDCKHWRKLLLNHNGDGVCHADNPIRVSNEDWYCADGERRTDDA